MAVASAVKDSKMNPKIHKIKVRHNLIVRNKGCLVEQICGSHLSAIFGRRFREFPPEDQQEDLGHLGHTHIEESTNNLPVQLFHGGGLKLNRFTSSFLKARPGKRDAKAVPIEYMIFHV